MGGRIDLKFERGRGSRVSVTLTLPAVAADAASVVRLPAAAGDGMPSLRRLLVEDNPTMADVLRGLLEVQGHHVVRAAHGLAALAELAHGPCNALPLDLELSGVAGAELARLVRSCEAGSGRRLPIVAITARFGGDEATRAAAAGMDEFLCKPVTGAHLAAALAACLDGAPDRDGPRPG